eukprot:SAG31_NODE_4077_length_3611_cov_1.879556_2_plen_123_part_00
MRHGAAAARARDENVLVHLPSSEEVMLRLSSTLETTLKLKNSAHVHDGPAIDSKMLNLLDGQKVTCTDTSCNHCFEAPAAPFCVCCVSNVMCYLILNLVLSTSMPMPQITLTGHGIVLKFST